MKKKQFKTKELEAFNARIWKAVRDAGLKGGADLARATNLNKVTCSSYLRGDRLASLEACMVIGKKLGCNPYWLYGGKETVPAPTHEVEVRKPKPVIKAPKPVHDHKSDVRQPRSVYLQMAIHYRDLAALYETLAA